MIRVIRPLGNQLLVEPIAPQEVTDSGLWLPDSAQEKSQQGYVRSVGNGLRDEHGAYITPEVETGDKVLFAKYAGTEIRLGDVKCLILRETDVLAIIEGDD